MVTVVTASGATRRPGFDLNGGGDVKEADRRLWGRETRMAGNSATSHRPMSTQSAIGWSAARRPADDVWRLAGTLCGENWLTVGEAASMPDPLTGNGVTVDDRGQLRVHGAGL